MSVRNVVQVMNFHALVRVDNAKKQAARYQQMQDCLMGMMDVIANNRNFRLDKSILAVPEHGREIHIYLGSDFGFCANYNSQVNDQLRADLSSEKIVIGKKLHVPEEARVLVRMQRKEFDEDPGSVNTLLEEAIKSRKCSRIMLTYNHYENTSTIFLKRIQIYPLQPRESETYTEDFAVEGNINELYIDLLCSYVNYELRLSAINSSAAENVLRQNTTTESLKKIDEIEEEKLMLERREKREKEFSKVIDTFVKKSMY